MKFFTNTSTTAFLLGLFFIFFLTSCKKEKVDITCSEATMECLDTAISIDSTKQGRKVLIIGIDGFRSEAMQQGITPFLFQLSQRGATFYTDSHIVEDLTFSGPNWGSLCTGVHWCKHNVSTNGFEDNDLATYPHFFHYIEQANSSLNTASIVNWLPVNNFIAKNIADYAPEDSRNDLAVYQAAEDALLNQNPLDPDVLFLHFDELDGAGHRFGFGSPIQEYNEVLITLDTYVADLFSIIENKRTNGEEWMVLVVSDHGGDGKGHSGGQHNDFINKTIFFANSPGENFLENYVSSQADLAPTVLTYLGITSAAFNCKTDGISLIE